MGGTIRNSKVEDRKAGMVESERKWEWKKLDLIGGKGGKRRPQYEMHTNEEVKVSTLTW